MCVYKDIFLHYAVHTIYDALNYFGILCTPSSSLLYRFEELGLFFKIQCVMNYESSVWDLC